MASAQELIRSLHLEEGVSEKDLAKRFGLSARAVRDILEQPPARPPHQLDPFRDQILNLLRSDRGATVKRVGALAGPLGAKLSDEDIRTYVTDLRKTVEPTREEPEAAPRTPPHPDPVPTPGPDGTHDFSSPDYYLNRELTWLNFNFRVLQEAEDERTPLLDRIKFISIVGSNLDEFFMKRIGGLKQQVGAGLHDLTVDGRTPQGQIDECHQVVRQLEERKRNALPKVLRALGEEGILLTSYEALSAEDRDYLRQHFFRNIYPLVTPQATDPAHPFPFISNLSLNLLVTLRHAKDDEPLLARVKVPVGAGIPRLLKLRDSCTFVPMESVMANNLDLLFPGMVIDSCVFFRVTRNANTELDEGKADDLLAMIETEMRERKFAPIVRLEVTRGIEPHHRGMIAAELGLDEGADVYEKDELLGMRDLMELKTHPELQVLQKPKLHDPPHHPVDHPAVTTDRNVFHVIRDAGSVLLQHPYESFTTSVERFLMEASRDPKVRAIKMCLYRTSAESKALNYLIDAARNGKQVAVVVELKARFDEEANIRWASRLENVGIHVTYGVVGLKTHCKVIQVVRQDHDGLRRYAHVGTGNYHAGTARLYSDLGLLTADPEIGQDLTELLNYLTTGFKPKRNYKKILPSPKMCKQALLQKIQREIDLHSEESPGLIQFKINAMEDANVTAALYRASLAGVQVDLVVRDTCRLRPGVPGLSESVRVVSIVGRFLEHTRVYYFRNGGEEEYYIGSADCMKRNLQSRVEALAPVEAPELRAELRAMLDAQLNDRRSGWEMQPDGSYVQRQPDADDPTAVSSQETLILRAEKRMREATRLRRRKLRGIERRNLRGT
jgi:polyphosphate kinase